MRMWISKVTILNYGGSVSEVMQTHKAPLPLNSVDSEVEAVDAGAVHIVHIVHIVHLLPQNQF